MTELNFRQRAAITKRNRTRGAFIDATEAVFTDSDYGGIQVEHIANHAGLSVPTFYNTFSNKAAWGAAVLDKRLNEALDKQAATETGSPRNRVLGHLGLLGEVANPLPGITQAFVDERTTAHTPYSELVPRYYGAVTGRFRDGQEQQVFRDDMEASEMADFALDSLAIAYAVRVDSPATRTMNLPSVVLDGLAIQKRSRA